MFIICEYSSRRFFPLGIFLFRSLDICRKMSEYIEGGPVGRLFVFCSRGRLCCRVSLSLSLLSQECVQSLFSLYFCCFRYRLRSMFIFDFIHLLLFLWQDFLHGKCLDTVFVQVLASPDRNTSFSVCFEPIL